MIRRRVMSVLTVLFLFQAGAVISFAKDHSSSLKDAADESAKAAKTVDEIMKIPEKAIPQNRV